MVAATRLSRGVAGLVRRRRGSTLELARDRRHSSRPGARYVTKLNGGTLRLAFPAVRAEELRWIRFRSAFNQAMR